MNFKGKALFRGGISWCWGRCFLVDQLLITLSLITVYILFDYCFLFVPELCCHLLFVKRIKENERTCKKKNYLSLFIICPFCPPVGEGLQVTVQINNRSTFAVMVNYILQREQSRICPNGKTTGVFPLLKMNAKPVRSHSKETITKVITIPRGIPPTISFGSPIGILYKLKVCLDISGSSFMYLQMPIIVLSNSRYSGKQQHQQQLLDDLICVVAEYPNQQSQRPGKRPPKPRSIDVPVNY
ncbi:uncharacterized protein LOC130912823 [Corythoichthys intestinalis]|uniref:uncharacterized protein LOC130912823 n=1 Tax=Corythoichthys intestinalis TaxID=161448 RepID=UPI0025A52264|nr:uncharacterized protein LOC130912823 [Corythoichthys intestinalis]